ncbi:MAG: class I SAM-dependent methyltransferase [Acidobacteria bacterium]|nr:class I SAM-dependent methyltransferase [Acidobacteriota bacterium]
MTRRTERAATSIAAASPEARGPELYETPANATRALMQAWPQFFGVARRIWDPACGPGAILDVLHGAGHAVLGSDLHDYSARWRVPEARSPFWNRDFFSWTPEEAARLGAEAIVMNPPYSLSDAFVTRALEFVPRVFVLLELRWMNGIGRERSRLLDGGYLHAVHPFDRRLAMHRDGWDGPRARQSRLHAWYVFLRPPMGAHAPAILRRINLPLEGKRDVSL